MARPGIEEKLPWRGVPFPVRRDVEVIFGAPVVRGMRVWGGYGPTPTYRLRLADGRRAFFKATNHDSNEFMVGALVREERVYRELGDIIGPWSPQFYGAFQRDDWHVLLLEDIGPPSAPPWTPTLARQVAYAYADFHASTLGANLPAWLPRPPETAPRVTWGRVAAESVDLRAIAALAGSESEVALKWLRTALPTLTSLADSVADLPSPLALVHGDTRSDNLRYLRGRLVLFDWPSAEVGRPEFDLAAFAQSIAVEGGPEPERIAAWYGERLPLDPQALDAGLAWIAAFFADLMWRPDIPGLLRLRPFQRAQFAVVLRWLAKRLHLPEPEWVDQLK